MWRGQPLKKPRLNIMCFNSDEYRNITSFSNRSFPSFKKFREVGLAYADGLVPVIPMFSASPETYLIAAEAYLKANNGTGSAEKV